MGRCLFLPAVGSRSRFVNSGALRLRSLASAVATLFSGSAQDAAFGVFSRTSLPGSARQPSSANGF